MKDKYWNWHHLQYYKFAEYFDVIPYFQLALDCGFIEIGWLHYTLSFHAHPACKRLSKYIKLIDKKLYLIATLTDWCTPRVMIHEDSVSTIIGPLNFEYEK